ncbi:MAG: SDR family oxidoreductase [Comamonas sp.]|uniref:SDR family NAD(P)-dependent oxidoreductase n=1 Tax=Comamonas sp. TaxID=34028 RepID=UPI002FC9BC2F
MSEHQHSPLRGKIALVTGGSNGIGAATVRALAGAGATVVIGYHQSLERAQALCRELPGAHHALRIGLEDQASHAAAAQWLAQTFDQVDILVNSAGFTQRIAHADTDTLDPDLFNSILCANVGGTYAVTRALLPLLRRSDSAVVVNLSSVSAFTGLGSNLAYCAAKAGLDTLTMSMARAFAPVRFLCVSPASVDTDFVGGRSRAELEKKAAQTPLGRVVVPDDVAQAVLACATHLRTATGARIVIDGGHSL